MTTPALAEVLNFEAAHPADGGVKADAITRQLGVSPARYYQLLVAYVRTEAALKHDPSTTNRVRRLIDERTETRRKRQLT